MYVYVYVCLCVCVYVYVLCSCIHTCTPPSPPFFMYVRSFAYSEDRATSITSAFNILAYLFPLFGGIIADSVWGKYKTILYLSIVYAP